MKIGIYRLPRSEDSEVYERRALYDAEKKEWSETSCGTIVSKASAKPSPEELKIRFEFENRFTIVRTPERMAAENKEVIVAEPLMSIDEGREYRDELGGPFPTKVELQYRRNQGVRVFPDGFELSEEVLEFYDEKGIEAVHESDFEDLDLSEAYNFDFHAPSHR